MKVDVIQTSWVGGRFSASLFGRTDIAQYANACAELDNWLIQPHGSILSTPGTEYINACKTGGSTGLARVIEFVFSRTDSYIIEMGVDYFRFYTNGALVVSPGTTAYEVAHTYTESELADVQFSQLNDIIYLSHGDHRTQKLTRIGASEWTLTDFDFLGGPFLPDNTDTSITIDPSATTGSITLAANSNIFTESGSTIGHINSYWKVAGVTTDATTGLDIQGYVKITAIANPSTATATVKETLSATGATASWAEGSWSAVRGYPARNAFHQQRLVFSRTAKQPQNVWASQNFIYDNYAVNSGVADDALDIELASNESNDIKWLASSKALIAGTYGGEFIIKSGDDGLLTPVNASARKETSWGSEAIIPKKIGNFFYYVQRFGLKLREIFYSWDFDNYRSVDKTILSPDISDEGIIDMAYQQSPGSILWCVTTGGNLATMTREVDQEVQGWSIQKTDGNYESVATIPSRDSAYDEVWVVVKRTVNGSTVRYIERFKNQTVPDRQDKCFYVHSGLSYDAYALTTSSTLGLVATAGTSVLVTSQVDHFVVGDIGQRIRAIDADGVTLGQGKIIGFSSTTGVTCEIEKEFTLTTYATQRWGLSVNVLSGMDHLETETVSVLVDGGTDKPNKVVSQGTVTLANDGFVIAMGLPYTQLMKTLPPEAGSKRGTSQGKIQRVIEAAFKVNRSHKGFLVGGSGPNTTEPLERVVFRDPSTLMGTPELLFTGVIPNVTVRSNWEYGTQMSISNSDPLPIELVSLITSVETSDK